MAIKMVREPSERPNINNIDDIIPMRYAYGGQNGFVIGKGTEISNTVSGLNFTVNSGRLVLQGVECDIDATGVTITIDNIATKRYYTIYLEVNLGLNTATIKDEYDTATYPTIDAGDDLTENTTGVARLPLYQFTATSGIISEVNKVVESIKYINSSITVDNSKKINNLEIRRDENNVLKIDDVIIPQKKLIFNQILQGQSYGDVVGTLLETVNVNDIIEIYFGKGTGLQFPLVLKGTIYNYDFRFSYSTVESRDSGEYTSDIIITVNITDNKITLKPVEIITRNTIGAIVNDLTFKTNISIYKVYKIIE